MAKFEKEENVLVKNMIEKEKEISEKGMLTYVSIFDNGVYLQFFVDKCTIDNEYYKLICNKCIKECIRRSGTELYISVY